MFTTPPRRNRAHARPAFDYSSDEDETVPTSGSVETRINIVQPSPLRSSLPIPIRVFASRHEVRRKTLVDQYESRVGINLKTPLSPIGSLPVKSYRRRASEDMTEFHSPSGTTYTVRKCVHTGVKKTVWIVSTPTARGASTTKEFILKASSFYCTNKQATEGESAPVDREIDHCKRLTKAGCATADFVEAWWDPILQIHCLVLEKLHETLLDTLVRAESDGEPFSLAWLLSVVVSVATSLQQIHTSGVIHGDIKGDHLMRASSDELWKFIDFGVSRSLQQQSDKPVLTIRVEPAAVTAVPSPVSCDFSDEFPVDDCTVSSAASSMQDDSGVEMPGIVLDTATSRQADEDEEGDGFYLNYNTLCPQTGVITCSTDVYALGAVVNDLMMFCSNGDGDDPVKHKLDLFVEASMRDAPAPLDAIIPLLR